MDKQRTYLPSGATPNRRIRKAAALLLVVAPMIATGFIALGVALDSPFVALMAVPPLVFVGVGIGMLQNYGDITVLDDGLDIGGRLVPFATISDVRLRYTNHTNVVYSYRGAEMNTLIGVDSFAKSNVPALVAELRMLAGLPEVEAAELVPNATRP